MPNGKALRSIGSTKTSDSHQPEPFYVLIILMSCRNFGTFCVAI